MKIRSLLALGLLFLILGLVPRAAAQTTIHVTTSTPGNSSGGCSLQEAIYSANFDQAIAIDTVDPDHFYATGCEQGNGTDTIVLPASMVFQMTTIVDDAHNQYGPTATPIIFTNIIIEANGSRLELVPGSPNMRAFSVGLASSIATPGGTVAGGYGNLTIRNVHIKGFSVKGGNGATGGGGGLGAGGAIYLNGGGLTVESSTFEGNGAVGGNGSANAGAPGGGGGGLSGNGGPAGGGSYVGGDFAGGGGGGGSRGDGGTGGNSNIDGGFGGGGGGTVTNGFSPDISFFTDGGFDCGGSGGHDSSSLHAEDGDVGFCPGGGGGGGQAQGDFLASLFVGSGGNGNSYGGGGGGGGGTGNGGSNGGNGGFGGGGGSGSTLGSNLDGLGPNGGNGGFGGGGGAGSGGYLPGGGPGHGGGPFIGISGNADEHHGGGGGAAGGAIFNHGGTVVIRNSTFYGNFVYRGDGGGGAADNGADAGGAIFSLYGSLTVLNSTISNNTSSGTYAGIFVDNEGPAPLPQTYFTLRNTIVANNGQTECGFNGPVTPVTYSGVGNLIVNDLGCTGLAIAPSPDPQLGPLQINAPGSTPTMAIQPSSPAVDVADAGTSLSTDQRGVSRPVGLGFDVGAFEAPAPAADLSLSKTVSSSTAQIGDTLTYTLTVTNLGPVAANSVVVTDNLPPAVTFASCSATGGGVCGGSGNSVSVSYTTLAANATASITLQATLNSGVADGTMVGNAASVAASSPDDPDSSNNTASASFTVQNRADLVVDKDDHEWEVEVGDQVTYTIKLTNNGPYAAKGVVLSDTQPSQVTFNSCTSTVGTCNLSAGVASLSLASFANGARATITVRATLHFGVPDDTTVTNTATVTASTFDPNTGNNSDKASFEVQNKSDLFVTKSAHLTSMKLGSNLIYTVTVWNRGPFKAKGVVFSDPLPSNSTFVSLVSFGVPCTAPAVGTVGVVTCTVGNLPDGAWATAIITVKVNGTGNKTSITNTATASAATFDPKMANNSASATTQIKK